MLDGLRKLGAFGIKIPVKYGGLGLSQTNYSRAAMLLGGFCGNLTALLSAHQSIGVPQPLLMFGTEEQKARFLPRCATGEISAFALTEPDVGSDPARMKTSAVADGDDFIINGEKLWCTNGTKAGLIVVMAQTPTAKNPQATTRFHRGSRHARRGGRAPLPFHGPARALQRRHPLQERARARKEHHRRRRTRTEGRAHHAEHRTHHAARRLHRAGEALPRNLEPLGPIARAMGPAHRQARRHRRQARAHGREHLRDGGGDLYVSALVDRDKSADVRLEAAMAKLWGTERAWEIVDDTMQIRGGRGYETAESQAARGERPDPVERLFRDARINTIFEGSSEIMRLFIAREMLDPHLKIGAAMFNTRLSRRQRAAALLKAAGHYALWYPRKWLPVDTGSCVSGLHPALAVEMRRAARQSRRLARALFHAMAWFGPGLEREQLVLGRLVDIATEIFVWSTAVSRAQSMIEDSGLGAPEVDRMLELAKLQGRFSRELIDARFRGLRRNSDRAIQAFTNSNREAAPEP